jgi:hypothetical protein
VKGIGLAPFGVAHLDMPVTPEKIWAAIQAYNVRIACSCGAAFERWVTPEAADDDLLRSRLLAFPN